MTPGVELTERYCPDCGRRTSDEYCSEGHERVPTIGAPVGGHWVEVDPSVYDDVEGGQA